MRLHEEPGNFDALVALAGQKLGVLDLHIEKDYWVTLALKNLAKSDFKHHVVFKGGTSLSKAHKVIHRFSEDIDLAVIVPEGSKGAAITRLIQEIEKACAHGFVEVPADQDPRVSKKGSFRKTVWKFNKRIEGENYGDAGKHILIEVNSFTIPEPHTEMEIESLIGKYLREEGDTGAINEFELQPFVLPVLRAERTFVEKISAIVKGSHLSEDGNFDFLSKNIRHFYDLAKLMESCGSKVLADELEFKSLLARVKVDDKVMNAKKLWVDMPYKDAAIFTDFDTVWAKIRAAYNGSFKNMIYAEENLPTEEKIKATIIEIAEALNKFE